MRIRSCSGGSSSLCLFLANFFAQGRQFDSQNSHVERERERERQVMPMMSWWWGFHAFSFFLLISCLFFSRFTREHCKVQSERMKWANRCIKLGNRKQRITEERGERESSYSWFTRRFIVHGYILFSSLPAHGSFFSSLGTWKTTTTLSLSLTSFLFLLHKQNLIQWPIVNSFRYQESPWSLFSPFLFLNLL